ncbi:tetratricopeptide repeat protein [Chthonomonas calidirosea]|uniref:tetratricopeptide repeat protein n=1 Tax=Chthonomonas calidirosea TaxID=454171 RepID=UPI0006EC566A|nr:tetratricopeptide repeat protein [Chthonomonas calidirosea]CEK14962.1 predicted ATPase [Chthonomonas calidirosea]
MRLPTGQVTFLLTDIEGSTRLWESHPEEMILALEQHDRIAIHAIQQYDGTIIKSRGEGDSLFAVFSDPLKATFAAAQFQMSLLQAAWPPPLAIIKVRMALHTGMATLREGDYFGPTVNRCARLRAIAHGGQILISSTTAQKIESNLPEGFSLVHLGTIALRDIYTPEPIYQLVAPGLPTQFPMLPTSSPPDAIKGYLPTLLTSFIGREKELKQLEQLLNRTRLLTLSGSGGCGKTRLAIEFAERLQAEFSDGIWFIELASIADPSFIPHAVANALGVAALPIYPSAQEAILEHLKSQRVLLLLDNCEHLIEAAAQFANTLLHTCPYLKIVATSREPLNITGEVTFRVPSLSLPQNDDFGLPERLIESEAVKLFLERAQAVTNDLSLSPENLNYIASICRRLDGIPLAIELAAARCRALSLKDIESHLGDMFQLLSQSPRTSISRHKTLRAALDWSYSPLTPPQKRLLQRLAVFTGGWTLEAAEAICADTDDRSTDAAFLPTYDVLDTLSLLTDRSLVNYDTHADRFSLLEPMRQYSLQLLRQSGEEPMLRERHAQWFTQWVEEAAERIPGPDQEEWFSRLERDNDNLRAVLTQPNVAIELRLRLAIALWRHWLARDQLQEGQDLLQHLLREKGVPSSPLKAKALHVLASLACKQGNYDIAEYAIRESLQLSLQHNDLLAAAHTRVVEGEIAHARGDYDAAFTRFAAAYETLKNFDSRIDMAEALQGLGDSALSRNECPSARAYYMEALEIRRTLKDQRGIANLLHALGNVALFLGKYAEAAKQYQESIEMRERFQDRKGIAASLNNLGGVALLNGDYAQAEAFCRRSLTLRQQIGDKRGIAFSLLTLGHIAREKGDLEEALDYSEQSVQLFQQLGNRVNAATALCDCSLTLIRLNELSQAAAILHEVVDSCREISSHFLCLLVIETAAELAAAQKNYALAAQLLGAYDQHASLLEMPIPPIRKSAQERLRSQLNATLGSEPFQQALESGHQIATQSLFEQIRTL